MDATNEREIPENESEGDTFNPPIGVVVVRETPTRDKCLYAYETTPTMSFHPNPCSSNTSKHGPTFSGTGAFRLQPRGKGGLIPSATPNDDNASHPSNMITGGRKRGAQCLAPSLPRSSTSQGRILFPTKASASSPLASESWLASPVDLAGRILPSASPGRMENALQSLSLRSPTRTPQGQNHAWKESVSLPFQLCGSPSPTSTTQNRNRGESLGSVTSMSSARTSTGSSTARSSFAPLSVLPNKNARDGPKFTMHQHPAGRSSSGSSPMILKTPPTNGGTPDTHPSTPRMDDIMYRTTCTPRTLFTPSSRTRRFLSPDATPLPRLKLTPRRSGTDASTPTCMSMSSPHTRDLDFSPASAGFFSHTSGRSTGVSYANRERSHRVPSYRPVSDRRETKTFSSPKSRLKIRSIPTDIDTKSNDNRPKVVIRSLLAPCGSHPSPSVQAIVNADAEAAARDCDGSLTDDEEDERFVLTDPALLAAEHQESKEEDIRPSQRRRTSIEGHDISDSRRPSLASQPATMSMNQPSSPTSLLGMSLLRGSSLNSIANSQSQRVFSTTGTRTADGYSPDSSQKVSADDPKMMKCISWTASFNSIGLDLESPISGTELNLLEQGDKSSVLERDLHTPPITQESLPSSSPLMLGQLHKDSAAEESSATNTKRSTSVFLSRSDPSNVHRAIALMIMEQDQQESPLECIS